MFDVKSYREYIMTEGDALEHARLCGDVQAMQRINWASPEKAKAIRTAIKVKVAQIAAIEARYA